MTDGHYFVRQWVCVCICDSELFINVLELSLATPIPPPSLILDRYLTIRW